MRLRKLMLMAVLAIVMLVFSIVPVSASQVDTMRVSANVSYIVPPACIITGRREGYSQGDYCKGGNTGPPLTAIILVAANSQTNKYDTEEGQSGPPNISQLSCSLDQGFDPSCSVGRMPHLVGKDPPS